MNLASSPGHFHVNIENMTGLGMRISNSYSDYANRTHDPITTRNWIPGIVCIPFEQKPLNPISTIVLYMVGLLCMLEQCVHVKTTHTAN